MLLHLLNTGLNQLTCAIFDVDYSILSTWISCTFYTAMHWLWYWFCMEWINDHVAIITTIFIPFLWLITEQRIVHSMQTRPASLMVDIDMIWFSKQGNCIIMETWISSWRPFFNLPGTWRIVKEVLNGFYNVQWTCKRYF
jgi:hypothetical protein